MISEMKKPPLIILTGPTASGKSRLAVRIAKTFDCEIISADSMQVYRGMDIGTAKVSTEETEGVPHHLIDVADPFEDYNVVSFKRMASACVTDILARKKLPLVCGGTGFYIQALLYGIDFTEEADDSSVRSELLEELSRCGELALHRRLELVDPESAAVFPAADHKRVLRALEFYIRHGKTISLHNREQREKKELPIYDSLYFVIEGDRGRLYEKIDLRVDEMLADGLEQEVRMLLAAGISPGSTAMQAIGYREMAAFLSGEITRDRAVELIKRNTRHYAKRQLTWFRREPSVIRLDPDTADPYELMCGKIKEHYGL